ncbi:MAG: 3-deoxy-D-manno-octulosonic acid transferase [Pelagibacteraceae bacterium TMED232]|nr:MAG: 3-deoxy-D-manno-octulosonic acid transferase [Pelagibacteraceae bacterium TMED232]
MFIIYRILINIIYLLSPIIILIRLIKKKEDPKRFKEKFCFFTKKKIKGKLIWIHGASVGELQSIVPLIEQYEKNKNIAQILITSNTLSSSKVISSHKFKKVIHQFFPVDTNLNSQNFLNYWKPCLSLFVDSEIWPNILLNLKKRKVPIILINGRITTKSFNRWIRFKNFSNFIFSKLDLCLSSSLKSKIYLKKLGAKNVKYFGNLKFSQSELEKIEIKPNLKKFIKNKKVWCASSTHNTEENFVGLVHQKLKHKYKNLLTVIIPRHINRINPIKIQLNQLGLNTHLHKPTKKVPINTDIYLVNSYGQTKPFFFLCKNVFLGGSLIKHGGQNPLEAARYGCNILHGPNVSNFDEIYSFLNTQNISYGVSKRNEMYQILDKLFSSTNNQVNIKKKLSLKGKKILKLSLKEIDNYLK